MSKQVISEALDVEWEVEDSPPINLPAKIVEPTEAGNSKEDFDTARANIHRIVEDGGAALSDLINIASSAESARGFEVVASLINSLVTANKELLNIHKVQKEISEQQPEGPGVVHNHLHMTTEQLRQETMRELGVEDESTSSPPEG